MVLVEFLVINVLLKLSAGHRIYSGETNEVFCRLAASLAMIVELPWVLSCAILLSNFTATLPHIKMAR